MKSSSAGNSSGLIINQVASCMRDSQEASYQGIAITYSVSGKIYRAYKSPFTNKVSATQIFSIDTSSLSGTINDVIVSDGWALVLLSDGEFLTFLRPDSDSSSYASETRTGSVSLSNGYEDVYTYVWTASYNSTGSYILYATPNWSNKDNFIYIYSITPYYNDTGYLLDVPITYVKGVNVGSGTVITSISMSSQYLVFGCAKCSSYNGQLFIYSRSTYTKLMIISGDNNNKQYNNLMFGSNVVVIDIGDPYYFEILAYSMGASGSALQKLYYINVIKVMVNSTTGALS